MSCEVSAATRQARIVEAKHRWARSCLSMGFALITPPCQRCKARNGRRRSAVPTNNFPMSGVLIANVFVRGFFRLGLGSESLSRRRLTICSPERGRSAKPLLSAEVAFQQRAKRGLAAPLHRNGARRTCGINSGAFLGREHLLKGQQSRAKAKLGSRLPGVFPHQIHQGRIL